MRKNHFFLEAQVFWESDLNLFWLDFLTSSLGYSDTRPFAYRPLSAAAMAGSPPRNEEAYAGMAGNRPFP